MSSPVQLHGYRGWRRGVFGAGACLFLWLDLSWVLSNGGSLLSCNGRYGLFLVCVCLSLSVPYKFPSLTTPDTEGPFVMCQLCLLQVWRGCHGGHCYPYPWLWEDGVTDLTWEAWGDQTIVLQRGEQGCSQEDKSICSQCTSQSCHERPWAMCMHYNTPEKKWRRERKREQERGLKKGGGIDWDKRRLATWISN